MDLSSLSLDNADLLQNIATLVWTHNNDHEMMEKITTARVVYELYQRVSGEREVEALRNQTILSICKYIKDNPKASKEDVKKELAKQIQRFAQKVEEL